MGACYATELTLRMKPENKGEITQLLVNKITTDVNAGKTIYGNYKQPSTLEDCLGLIFAQHQNDFVLTHSGDPIEEQYDVSSGFNATYSWEGLMVDFFDLIAPLLIDGSELWIYPDSDYDHLVIKDGKSIQLH